MSSTIWAPNAPSFPHAITCLCTEPEGCDMCVVDGEPDCQTPGVFQRGPWCPGEMNFGEGLMRRLLTWLEVPDGDKLGGTIPADQLDTWIKKISGMLAHPSARTAPDLLFRDDDACVAFLKQLLLLMSYAKLHNSPISWG